MTDYDPPPCPAWCVTNHAAILEIELRECGAASEPIATLTHHTISAEAIRLYDPITGQLRPVEVRIGDDTVTAENARRLAAQLLNAADIADADR